MLKKIVNLMFILTLIVGCEVAPLEQVSFEDAYNASEIYHLNIQGLR